MLPTYRDYIREKFSRATMSEDPFPHLYIRDALPPELYREMETALPAASEVRGALRRDRLRRWARRPWRLPNPDPGVFLCLGGGEGAAISTPIGRVAPALRRHHRARRNVAARTTARAGALGFRPARLLLSADRMGHPSARASALGSHKHDDLFPIAREPAGAGDVALPPAAQRGAAAFPRS